MWPTNETIQETPTFEDLPPESITPSPIIEEIAVSDKESPVDRVLSSETSELSFLPTLEALPPEPFLWLPTGLSRMDERESYRLRRLQQIRCGHPSRRNSRKFQ